jgi:TRAP-type uncharacterized transport system substrate-binding protein
VPSTDQCDRLSRRFQLAALGRPGRRLFARDGIEVELTKTPNSAFQLTDLIAGTFDIAMTAIDNVVAYMEGQGEAPVATTPSLWALTTAS